MKKFLALLSITVFFLGNVQAQQSKVYILFDAKYTKKLTYEKSIVGALNMQSNSNKEKGETFERYAFPGHENITAYFKTSKKKRSLPFTELPVNTITAKDKRLNVLLLDSLQKTRQVAYLLKRTSKGYDSYSIEGTSYVEETSKYITYSNSEGTYEIAKVGIQVSYTPTLVNGLDRKLTVSPRIEENRIIGYKVETSGKQLIELIPGLGLRSETGKLKTVKLKYVNQFTTKDYIDKLAGDLIPVVASGAEKNNTNTLVGSAKEPIAGTSTPSGFFNEGLFVEPEKEVKAELVMNKRPIKSVSSKNVLVGTPFQKVGQKPVVLDQLPETTTRTVKGYYRVVDGDNLYAISRKFNIPVKRIMALNKLDSYNINVNQQLKVEDDGSVVSSMNPTLLERQEANSPIKSYIYKIEQNDTLFSIANKFKTTIAKLCILNKIEDINHALNIDDELIIRQSTVVE